jgi:DNA (cytosine-5)-methyltransferase 1
MEHYDYLGMSDGQSRSGSSSDQVLSGGRSMKGLELFAGAGGLGMGASLAGFLPVQVVEWDRWCCDTINENRSRGVSPVDHWPKPTDEDVRNLDFRRLEGKVDVITGGPPCQPFSLGGKHRAYDDERDMWSEAVRAVRQVRPKAFIFENVKGLTRQSFANYFSYIHLQLEHPEIVLRRNESWENHLSRLEKIHTGLGGKGNLNYRVVTRILNAANYGIPQRRERVVFVGFREDLELEWSFPEETHSLDSLLWSQTHAQDYWERHKVAKQDRTVTPRMLARAKRLTSKPAQQPWLTVRDAISDLPDPEYNFWEARKIEDHRFQPGARPYPGHTGSHLDEPAKTLKAGVHGVPGGENMLLRPDGSVRYFSVRESARLQTFPDNFVFHGAWGEIMRQLGNAVPVRLAEIIAKDVRAHLDNR